MNDVYYFCLRRTLTQWTGLRVMSFTPGCRDGAVLNFSVNNMASVLVPGA